MGDDPLYDRLGTTYSVTRRTDPRWEAAVVEALGSSRSIVNVGAGTGSYEPKDRAVVAVDPSLVMLSQRAPDSAPAAAAFAEALPFGDKVFDASMAVLTVHHWTDWRAGLAEMKRVTRTRIVILTADVFGTGMRFWLADYFPEIHAYDQVHMQHVEDVLAELWPARVVPLVVPADCTDGFLGAFWRRPEAYLDPAVRAGISRFGQVDPGSVARGVRRLRDDLSSGRWRERYADVLAMDEIDLGYRLIVADATT